MCILACHFLYPALLTDTSIIQVFCQHKRTCFSGVKKTYLQFVPLHSHGCPSDSCTDSQWTLLLKRNNMNYTLTGYHSDNSLFLYHSHRNSQHMSAENTHAIIRSILRTGNVSVGRSSSYNFIAARNEASIFIWMTSDDGQNAFGWNEFSIPVSSTLINRCVNNILSLYKQHSTQGNVLHQSTWTIDTFYVIKQWFDNNL